MAHAESPREDTLRWICGFIRAAVEAAPRRWYRTPLVGLASADHPGFRRLREAVASDHCLPEEILPGARSVVAFFIPFSAEIISDNARTSFVARSWAEAYVETNRLIQEICAKLTEALEGRGVRAGWAPPTHAFDPVRLVSRWSHKHVAYLCGLGRFGMHHQLITPSGCAGRIGSLVLSEPAQGGGPMEGELCLQRAGGSCLQCAQNCPAGALTAQGLDRARCYRWLLDVDRGFADLPTTDVCGKCSVQRCAVMEEGGPLEAPLRASILDG